MEEVGATGKVSFVQIRSEVNSRVKRVVRFNV